jgi:hypothetical protein
MSGTTPTMVSHGSSDSESPTRMRRPMGLSPGKYRSANGRFTSATGRLSRVSWVPKSRPCNTLTPKVSKWLGVVMTCRARG